MEKKILDLFCEKCKLPLSVAPITFSKKGIFCGRCPHANSIIVTIYEHLAKKYKFPCRYHAAGCMEQRKFGTEMEQHEYVCPKQKYICLFGKDCPEKEYIIEAAALHWKQYHPESILTNCKFDWNPEKATSIRKVFIDKDIGCMFMFFSLTDVFRFHIKTFGETNHLRIFKSFNISVYSEISNQMFLYTSISFNEQEQQHNIKFLNSGILQVTLTFVPNENQVIVCNLCHNQIKASLKICDQGHNYCEACSSTMYKCLVCNTESNSINKQKSDDNIDKSSFFYVNLNNEIAYDCPIKSDSTCSTRGNLKDLSIHIQTSHKNICITKKSVNIRLPLNSSSVFFFHIYGNIFKCNIMYLDFMVCVQVLSFDIERKFNFAVAFSNDDSGRQMRFTEQVQHFTPSENDEAYLKIIPMLLEPFKKDGCSCFSFSITEKIS